MNTKRRPNSFLGAGLAVLAIGLAASARPASAQAPLLFHPLQVRQVFGDWNHNQDRDHDQDRDHGRNRDGDRNRRRAEQARRDADRARHEAEVRRAQWQRDHRHDRNDHDRNDTHRGAG